MKHKVDIIVVLKKTIEVEAEFESEAVNAMWDKLDEPTADFSDFDVGRDFKNYQVKACKDKAYIIVD